MIHVYTPDTCCINCILMLNIQRVAQWEEVGANTLTQGRDFL